MKACSEPRPGAPRGRRGGVLLLVMISLSAVTVVTGLMLQLSGVSSSARQESVDRMRSVYLAEAGLAEAYTALAIGKTGDVGSLEDPAVFGDGLFWTEGTDLGDDRVQIDATGRSGRGRAILSLVAEKTQVDLAAMGVFTTAPLLVPKGSLIDGYHSGLGTYEQQAATGLEGTQAGRVASNGTLTIDATESDPTLINGDATYGPASTIDLSSDATVTGEKSRATAATQPPPPVPPDVPILPGVMLDNPVPLVLTSGDYGFSSIEIKTGAELSLSGPLQLVVGNLRIEDDAKLTFDTAGGRVDIFVLQGMESTPDSELGGNTDPTLVSIQVVGDVPTKVGSATPLYGVLYAPDARVETVEGFEIFGSIVARELILRKGARMHFDRALLEAAEGAGALPRLMTWRIVELATPNGTAVSPFDAMGLDATTLSPPAGAHADQQLEITYKDLAGATRTYAGWESGFDWSNVDSVLFIARDGTVVVKGTEASQQAAQEPQEPVQPTPAEQVLMDLFTQTPPMSSGDLKNALLAASPLTGTVLAYIMGLPAAQQPMTSGDVDNVLGANSPMADDVLEQVLRAAFDNTDTPLSSGDFKVVMLGLSPLSPTVVEPMLLEMLASPNVPMTGGDYYNVLEINSPLPAAVLAEALASPKMDPTQKAELLLKQ